MALALLAREEMIGLIDWKEEKVTVAPPDFVTQKTRIL